ncbi:MAG: hypothetical protein ACK4R3_00625 [Aliihoeflea sp.]
MHALPVQDKPLSATLAGGSLHDLNYVVFEARTKDEAAKPRKPFLNESGFTVFFAHIELATVHHVWN